jgi:hypothetical protein
MLTKEDEIRKAQGRRLAMCREAAGFNSARQAALECGWPESSYRSHENGSRTIGLDDARKYIDRFTAAGAQGYSAQWVLFGDGDAPEQSLDDMIRNKPPEVRKRVYQAVRDVLKRR